MFGEMEAIDSLLQQLAYYKRHDPNQVEVSDFASFLVPTVGMCFQWRHRLDADPDLNFHYDGYPDPDLDPDWRQNIADPTPNFTNVWKIRICFTYILINSSSQCFPFLIGGIGVIILSILDSIFKFSGKK